MDLKRPAPESAPPAKRPRLEPTRSTPTSAPTAPPPQPSQTRQPPRARGPRRRGSSSGDEEEAADEEDEGEAAGHRGVGGREEVDEPARTRHQQQQPGGRDRLSALSDELLLRVLAHLPLSGLLGVAPVSR